METVGFLELSSIAQGVETADVVLKAAEVELLFARAVCPGKYVILFTGDVAAVTAALEAGQQCGGSYLVDQVVIPRVHPQVIRAIHQMTDPGPVNALGILEFFSITAAIYAADAAAKAAEISLLDVRLGLGIGGKSFVVLTGEVAAVQEAVRCGRETARESGLFLNAVVIPSPRPELYETLY